jgi:hypothetical protein
MWNVDPVRGLDFYIQHLIISHWHKGSFGIRKPMILPLLRIEDKSELCFLRVNQS